MERTAPRPAPPRLWLQSHGHGAALRLSPPRSVEELSAPRGLRARFPQLENGMLMAGLLDTKIQKEL